MTQFKKECTKSRHSKRCKALNSEQIAIRVTITYIAEEGCDSQR